MVTPETKTGEAVSLVDPFPSCPCELRPQQTIVELVRSAHDVPPPAATCEAVAFEMTDCSDDAAVPTVSDGPT